MPAKPWCVVIAATTHIAEQYIDAFGLSREMWDVAGYDERRSGQQYDRVVVIRPHWELSSQEKYYFESITLDYWMTSVGRGGSFKII